MNLDEVGIWELGVKDLGKGLFGSPDVDHESDDSSLASLKCTARAQDVVKMNHLILCYNL